MVWGRPPRKALEPIWSLRKASRTSLGEEREWQTNRIGPQVWPPLLRVARRGPTPGWILRFHSLPLSPVEMTLETASARIATT